MIQEIKDKEDYALLLTESDPNINIVEEYLDKGRLFGYYQDNEPVSFLCVEKINDQSVEIKNLLTLQNYRGNGYAKALVKHVESLYKDIPTILISTPNSSMTNMTIYTRLGYRYSHRIENYFIDYYPQEIFENDLQAVDLMYFTKSNIGLN